MKLDLTFSTAYVFLLLPSLLLLPRSCRAQEEEPEQIVESEIIIEHVVQSNAPTDVEDSELQTLGSSFGLAYNQIAGFSDPFERSIDAVTVTLLDQVPIEVRHRKLAWSFRFFYKAIGTCRGCPNGHLFDDGFRRRLGGGDLALDNDDAGFLNNNSTEATKKTSSLRSSSSRRRGLITEGAPTKQILLKEVTVEFNIILDSLIANRELKNIGNAVEAVGVPKPMEVDYSQICQDVELKDKLLTTMSNEELYELAKIDADGGAAVAQIGDCCSVTMVPTPYQGGRQCDRYELSSCRRRGSIFFPICNNNGFPMERKRKWGAVLRRYIRRGRCCL